MLGVTFASIPSKKYPYSIVSKMRNDNLNTFPRSRYTLIPYSFYYTPGRPIFSALANYLLFNKQAYIFEPHSDTGHCFLVSMSKLQKSILIFQVLRLVRTSCSTVLRQDF